MKYHIDMSPKEKYRKFKSDPLAKTKVITFFTMVYNFVWSIAKILVGFFQTSYLYVLSGTYTLLLGFSKKIFISNHSKTAQEINKETKSIIMGVLILISGIAFGSYMALTYVSSQNSQFGLIWAIALAFCSFVELEVAIYNLLHVKKKNDILLASLRCCNFVSALYAIVLTQVAILSVTNPENVVNWNSITALVASVVAIIVGTTVIVKSYNKNRQKKYEEKIPIERVQDHFDDFEN